MPVRSPTGTYSEGTTTSSDTSALHRQRRELLNSINGANNRIGRIQRQWTNRRCVVNSSYNCASVIADGKKGSSWQSARSTLRSIQQDILESTAKLGEIEVSLACKDRGPSQFDRSGWPSEKNNYWTLADRLLPYHPYATAHPVCTSYSRPSREGPGFDVDSLVRSDLLRDGETSADAIKRLQLSLKADRAKLKSDEAKMKPLWAAVRPSGGPVSVLP
jgi:hypothetical protein